MATEYDYVALVPVNNANSHFCFHCNRVLERSAIVQAPRFLHRSDGSFETSPQNSKRERGSTFGHKDDFLAFVASADEGCHLCSMLLATLSTERRQKMQEFHKIRPTKGFMSTSEHTAQRVARFVIKLGYQSPEPWSRHHISQNPVQWALMHTYLRPSLNPICDLQADEDSLQQDCTWKSIHEWINKCNQHHDCMQQVNKIRSSRPTRLISVGQSEDFSDIKLCRSHEINADAKYLTLSHCWGPDGLAFKLVKECERELRNKMNFEMLPQTFKDAISVTRKLQAAFGVSYIWIDALCILQDSTDDWKHESRIMGDIYLNSFCNLAACVGDNSSAGLFHERKLYSVHRCAAQGGAHSCFEGSFEVGNLEAYRDDVRDSVLLSRGWVFQEIALAPRVLYFTLDQVFWKCDRAFFEENRPREDLEQSIPSIPNYHQMALEQPTTEPDEQELDRLWADTIGGYSICKLTKSKDKLVAISGLARILKDRFGEHNRYIAGLWTRDLFLQLLWEPSRYLPYFTGQSPRQRRPKVHRAPTWSWASMDNAAATNLVRPAWRDMHASLIDIVSVPEESLSGDLYTDVQSGAITIKGKVYQADLLVSRHEADHHIKYGDRILLENVAFRLDVPREQEGTCPVYCLPVAEKIVKDETKTDLYGLVLQKTGYQSCFERIGRFGVLDISQASNYHAHEVAELISWQDFVVEHTTEPSIVDGNWNEIHEENTYTIKIL